MWVINFGGGIRMQKVRKHLPAFPQDRRLACLLQRIAYSIINKMFAMYFTIFWHRIYSTRHHSMSFPRKRESILDRRACPRENGGRLSYEDTGLIIQSYTYYQSIFVKQLIVYVVNEKIINIFLFLSRKKIIGVVLLY